MLEGFQNAAEFRSCAGGCCSPSRCSPSIASASPFPTPGIDGKALADFFQAARNTMFGLVNLFSGGALEQLLDLRARHHAVHQRLDHPAAADRRHPVPRTPLEGGRGRAAQDHPVHALRHRAACRSCRACSSASGSRRSRRRAARRSCFIPGWSFRVHDRDHAHLRDRVHHVARRADLRARHRQRHLADHLRRHRRRRFRRRPHHGRVRARGRDGRSSAARA